MSAMAAAGGAGGARDPVVEALKVADPTPEFTRCYTVRDGKDGFGRAFCCLGCGGFGAVFEAYVTPDGPGVGRVPAELVSKDKVLAMKQVYKDPATIAKVELCELKGQLELRDAILADPGARATMVLTVDGFKGDVDASGKQLLRIIMLRAPTAVPFAYEHRPKDALQPIPEFRLGNEKKGSRADLFENDLTAPGRMSPEQIHYAMRQLLTALAFLHSAKLTHRDVKCDNILVWGTSTSGSDGVSEPLPPLARELGAGAGPLPWVKLADYGLARVLAGDGTVGAGTTTHMAPEQILAPNYNTPVDIFAAGCVLYHLLMGVTPMDCRKVRTFEERFPKHAHPGWELNDMTRRLKGAFRAMTTLAPEMRPSAAELLARDVYFG